VRPGPQRGDRGLGQGGAALDPARGLAEGGKEGLEILKSVPDIDMVLMDIMMPELDGYDTIRMIRGYEQFKDLPIIAVTAKAMKGDRKKCLDAGASDYIAKPVNVEQLTSLLSVWLNR